MNKTKDILQAEKQFDDFTKNVQDLTLDQMNKAKVEEIEPQTKIAQRDMDKKPDIYLKPFRSYPSKEKFNENYRKAYEYAREYVHFIAENHEVVGEEIHIGALKKFPGTPVEEWKVPVNKPVWAPRMVAERIADCQYHRLQMVDRPTEMSGNMTFYGQMVVDTTKNRLNALPVSTGRSVFMGKVA